MARVHLDIKFPFEKTKSLVMRFDRKSKKKDILQHICETIKDPTLNNAKIIVHKNSATKVWFKKGDTLKSLGVESDMALIILRNPIRIQVEFNSQNIDISFSPSQTINDVIGKIAENASIIYYLGYSLFPVLNGKVIPVYEELPLSFQVRKYDKIIFGLKYYPILLNDMEPGIPLSRTYSLTRDYILSGNSPIQKKDYISLCAKIAVIESGDELDDHLLSFNSAYFTKYLPIKLKADPNSEDDLFDQIQLNDQLDMSIMRYELIRAARSIPTFGTQSFDVTYLKSESESQSIYLCIGYKSVLFVQKNDLSLIDAIDMEGISYEIDIDGIDKFIINEKYQITTSPEQIFEIESLIKGYSSLRSKLSKINEVDAKLESTVYNHVMENDSNLLQKIASPLLKVINHTTEYFLSKKLMESSVTNFNESSINSVGNLYFVSSGKIPNFGNFTIETGFNLKEKGKAILDMLGIVSKDLRSMTTTYYDLETKYGNDLRSVVFIVHLMRKKGIDQNLCDEIMLVYKRISLEMNTEVTIAKLKGFYDISRFLYSAPFVFPSVLLKDLFRLIKSILSNIQVAKKSATSKEKKHLLKKLDKLMKGIDSKFTSFHDVDDMKFFEKPIENTDTIDQITYYVSVFSIIDPPISYSLSRLLMYFENLRTIALIFPNTQSTLDELIGSIGSLIRDSYNYAQAITDLNMKERTQFIYEIISQLQQKLPDYNTKCMKRNEFEELKSMVNKFFKDLIVLKEDQSDDDIVNYWMLCYSLLMTSWCFRILSETFVYDNEEDLANKKKVKLPKNKTQRIRLQKDLTLDDEIELSKESVEKLNLEFKSKIDPTVNLIDFIREINAMNPTMGNLFELLQKWKPLIEVANPSDPSFDSCKTNYEFGLHILFSNAERQNRYQPPGLLLMKIHHHTKQICANENIKFKSALDDITDRFNEFYMVSKLPKIKDFLKEVNEVQKKSTSVKSLIFVLQKLINYLSMFKETKFSVTQIIKSLNDTEAFGLEIVLKVIHTQFDDQLETIVTTLISRIRDIQKIKKDILIKTLNTKTSHKITKKLTGIRNSISGLFSYLPRKLMRDDGKNFFESLSISCWLIFHCNLEVKHSTRLTIQLSESSTLLKELAEALQAKILVIQTIPEELISQLFFYVKDVEKCTDASSIETILFGLTEIYHKQYFWQVSPKFKQLLNSLELSIGRIIQKPYIYMFNDYCEQHTAFKIDTTVTMVNEEVNDYSSSSSDSDAQDECKSTKRVNRRVSRTKTLSVVGLDTISNGVIRVSRSESNIGKDSRPGILLDPTTTVNRKPTGPHVTFDLTKDKDAPIFSENRPTVINESLPNDMIPLFPSKKPSFMSWNLPQFINHISLPSRTPTFTAKPIPRMIKRKTIRKVDSFSQLTFDVLRLNEYKDFNGGYQYNNSEKAEEDIETLVIQCQNCLNVMKIMQPSPIPDRVFFVIDWISAINSVPIKIQAARQYNIKEIDELISIYNQIKVEIDLLVDELKVEEFQPSINVMNQLMKFLRLIRFALQKAETDLMQIDLRVKDMATSWLLYADEVIETFQEMIDIDEPLVLIGSKAFLESVFNGFVKFGQTAEEIDKTTKRQIMVLIQCQLCLQLRNIVTSVKRMETRDVSTIPQVLSDVIALKDRARKEMSNEVFFLKLLDTIEQELQKTFVFADADWYSLQLRDFVEARLINDIHQASKKDQDALLSGICFQTVALRYNMLNIRFTEPAVVQSTLGGHVKKILEDFEAVNEEFKTESENKDSILIRNVAQKWSFFFSAIECEFNEMASSAAIMVNSSNRLKSTLKYLTKIGVELIKIDNPKFILERPKSYQSLNDNFLKMIDYILMKLEDQNPQETMSFVMESEPKMPKVKVTRFTSAYKSYNEKSAALTKGTSKESLLVSALISQLKAFSKKFLGSFVSIYECIVAITSSMEKIIPALDQPSFNDLVKEQNKILKQFKIKDVNPICNAEITILQKVAKLGELVVALILYNLSFFLTKTTDSKDILKLIKSNGIEDSDKYKEIFKDDLHFSNSFESIVNQLEIFTKIHKKAVEAFEAKNPFNFTDKEKEILNQIRIIPGNTSASLTSAIKAHNYISQIFASLFIYSNPSHFITAVNKFVTNSTIYFGYYNFNQNYVLSQSSKEILQKMNKIFTSFDDLKQFRQLYLEINESFKLLRNQLDDYATIFKFTTKSERIDKVMEIINNVDKSMVLHKSKGVNNILHEFIKSLQQMTKLKLRVLYDINDLIAFAFAIKTLTYNKSSEKKNLETIVKIFLLDTFDVPDTISNPVIAYISTLNS
ncbi:hypothetical protein TRFO_10256 [Tritrichomonas foetus]|uniref:Ubiquitin-like domain-containing protein n=1 Tax=Tritrichomonas foetus TaxID=1144522 RepID=A0A1J4JC77_9EUKA|nr:hypothetical protein TRFO_10256 [Tritrichomonas foetus]|eukprot:OHS95855.1 hypothetical protein TRFO_10256 [Tritrichomonas foetus]